MLVVILLFVMGESQKKRLGEILVEDGCLTPENLEEALQHQKKEGGMVGQILIRLGYITEESLIAAVGKQLQIPYIPLSNYSINMDAASQLGEEFCRRHLSIVFDQDDKKIYMATADPLNETLVEEVHKKSKLKVQLFISTPSELFSMLDVIFRTASKELKKAS
jgi:hypothetical protein